MFEKITSIEGLGLFNQDSFAGKIDLKKYNIIYGYNGTGKTSLSRAFRFLEQRQIPICLVEENPNITFSYMKGGKNIRATTTSVKELDANIRVFNCDYT